MKLALLGTGMIVKDVLPVLQTIEGIELTAILSTPRSLPVAQELAERFAIGYATSDYAQILADSEVEVVYVALPNHLHHAYAKEALLAGKHVICEKPFTLLAADLEDLVAIAEQKNLFLLEAITNQYLGNFAQMKAELPKLGDIKIVTCNFSQYSSRYDAFKRGEIAPAFDPAQGGGALRDLNIYNIHLVVGLFGRPERVFYQPNMEREVDTSGLLTMDYGHFKAVCIGAKDSSAVISSTIQGNKGSLTVDGPTNALPSVTLSLNGQAPMTSDHNSPHHRMHAEFVAFEAMIRTNDRAAAQAQLNHSRAVMAVLDEAVASMAE